MKYSKPYNNLYKSLTSNEIKKIKKMNEIEVKEYIDFQNKENAKHRIFNNFTMSICNIRGEVPQIFLEDEKLVDFLETTDFANANDLKSILDFNEMTIINLPDREESLCVWHTCTDDWFCHSRSAGNTPLLIIQNSLGSYAYPFEKIKCDMRLKTLSVDDKTLAVKSQITEKEVDKNIRLVVNTFAYMSAFPDMVKNGLPKGCKIEIGASSKKKTLKTNPALIESEKGFTPHMVRGHFRYLSSEVFTKKRNTWVFVKSYFTGTKEVKTVEKESIR